MSSGAGYSRISGSGTQNAPVSNFPGTGRKVSGEASSSLMARPLTEDEKYIQDAHAPHSIPKEKAAYAKRWTWKPKGTEGDLNMGKIGILDVFKNLRWGDGGSIIDSEIHIVYLPHLPVEIYRKHNIEISLTFEGAEDDEIKLMSKAVFPSPYHTHVIFFPGHSFASSPKARFPWSLRFSTTAALKDDYPIADIIIMFKGYNTPLSQFSDKSGANIISLVPVSEVPTGVTLTRPRHGGDWKVNGIHFGVRSQKDVRALMMMQEAGIDIEGLQVLGKLHDAVKAVNKITEDPTSEVLETDAHKRVKVAVMGLISKK